MSHLTVVQEDSTLTVTQAVSMLTAAASGPQGPPGPAGPAGGDVFVHAQSAPAATWIITHNRNRRVHVSLLNDNDEVVFADVEHGDLNTTTITFPAPTTGVAVIS